MELNTLVNILDILFWIVYMLNVPKMLHIMQLESYQNDGMFRWITKNSKTAFKKGARQLLIVSGVFFASSILFLFVQKNLSEAQMYIAYFIRLITVGLTYVIVNSIYALQEHKERKAAKKPLKYTGRAKRLIVYNFFTLVILQFLFMGVLQERYSDEIKQLGNLTAPQMESYQNVEDYQEALNTYQLAKAEYYQYDNQQYLNIQPLLFSFLIFTLPLNIIIANWLASPLETSIGNHYINQARRKLKKKEYKDLIRIGITGSYGKTSTKFILKTILSEKYSVLATPGSYNTTMGNVKIIREELKPEHQVFISEMGARKRYDIQEICQFVNPQIGIITSIGPQHLETFKKIENVAKTKAELLKGVTPDGKIFLPKDNSYCMELYKKDEHEKYLYSIKKDGADVYAKDIKVNKDGSTFKIVYQKEEFACKTKLLGEHNVQNIVGCVAIAKSLGLTNEEIARGIEKIEPVEHRLQLITNPNGTTVIDDAFNSNPIGSQKALDVLKQFEGRKIIVTPGMVELGADEYKYNKEFGEKMADVVDIAILVGQKRSEAIVEGLKNKKFDQMNIYVVKDLNEATQKLGKLSLAGDVILFENDLPDNYNE